MLFWSGHGILIPILAVVGFVAGLIGGAFLRAAFNLPTEWGLAFGGIGAVFFVWLYASTIGKTREQTLLDPRSGGPVVIRTRHTFFFIPAKGWLFLLILLAVAMTALSVMTPRDGASNGRGSVTDSSGEKAFDAANGLITTASKGVAHGNTDEAKKLAEAFSQRLKDLREMGIEEGKKPAVSLSKGEFLTYCLLTKESCVFLVHVPELRKFADEARDFICKAAWRSAQEVVQGHGATPASLGVGVRGALLYERAMAGKVAPLGTDSRAGIDKEVGGNDETGLLKQLFELAEKPAVADAVPAVADASMPQASAPTATPVAAPAMGALPTALRDWKGADGRMLSALLVRFADAEGKTAEFKRADGQVFQVPVERFDAAVQEELKQLHQSTAQ